MKTVIDAVNEFKGEWPDHDDLLRNDEVLILVGDCGSLEVGATGYCDYLYKHLCNELEFNQCVDEMSKAEWMKPAIDWSIAPEDCLGAVHLKDEFTKSGEDYGIFVTKTKGSMEDGYHYCGKKSIGPVMSSHTFTPKPAIEDKITECSCGYCGYDWQCKLSDAQTMTCPGCGDKPDVKPVTVPVYTQEMVDDGIMPLVGMECLILNDSSAVPNYNKAVIKYMGDLVIYAYIEDTEQCDSLSHLKFKPLTPPIVLEDGKAYQFTYDTESSLLLDDITGVYDSDKVTCMWVKGNAYSITRCTNIQLLEVKS